MESVSRIGQARAANRQLLPERSAARDAALQRTTDDPQATRFRRWPAWRRPMPRGWVLLGLSLLALVVLSGCRQSEDQAGAKKPKFEVAEEEGKVSDSTASVSPAPKGNRGQTSAAEEMPPATGVPQKPPSIPSTELDTTAGSIKVPEGTPEELLTFIDGLRKQADTLARTQPPAGTENMVMSKLQGLCGAELKAADKVLATKPDVAVRRKAVDARLHAMRILSLVSPQESRLDEVRKFAQVIAVDPDPAISLQGRVILLGLRIGDLRSNREKDIQGIVNDLTALLANERRDQSVLDVTQQAEMTLRMLGHEKEADAVFKAIAESFKDHADPALAKEAAAMFQELKLRQLGLDEKLDAVARKEKDAVKPFMSAIQTALTQAEPTIPILNKTLRAVSMLEQTGQYALGLQICQLIQDAAAKITNPPLKVEVDRVLDMAKRRLQLVGKPFEVQGTNLDGAAFDFAKYKGKVILVDFWSTKSQPCIAELPGLRDIYKKFHDKGFEIIGVSMDRDRNVMAQFLQSEKLPWTTIASEKMVQQGGVEAVPFAVLLDRTGMAVDLHLHGSRLEQKLVELLGPPAAPPASSPTSPRTPSGTPPPAGKQSFIPARSSAHVVRSLAACAAWLGTDDETARATKHASSKKAAPDDPPIGPDEELPDVDESANPYLAPDGIPAMRLIEFLIDMQEKPRSIQARPGFAEAIVDAADRVLQSSTKTQYRTVAALAKLSVLHEKACLGDARAERMLRSAVTELANEKPPAVTRRVAFLRLEQRALDSDNLPADKIPPLLDELKKFFVAQDALTKSHLRLASLTVHAINRIDDVKRREEYFADFGKMFAQGEDKQLARYGKTLIGTGTEPSNLVGQTLQLEGSTAMGTQFDWDAYRGKHVIVDFWATWCGPCRREMPHLKALYESHKDGLRVVAVSLDTDMEALATYLKDQKIDWENLVGDAARDMATRYGVRGIPTMMLLDPEGKVLKVAHRVEELQPSLEQKLARQ